MLGLVVRRLVASVLVLLAATALAFGLVEASSDPLAHLRVRQPPVPAAVLDNAAERLYLDRPVVERYWLWLTGIGDTNGDIGLLRGRWGPSVRELDIGEQIRSRSAASLRLLGAAIVLSLAAAIVTGVVSAVRAGSRLDSGLRLAGYLALAMPTFWLAALLKEGAVWLNQQLGTRVLFTIGESSPDAAAMGVVARVGDVAGHLVLPTLALALTGYAAVGRQQRAALLDVLDRDHVRLARAKGLPARTVLRRHALRLALIPTTSLAALVVAGAVTGSIIAEQVFRWRGLGTFLLDAVGASDTNAVMAFVVVSGVAVVAANVAADAIIAALDPRTRRA